MEMILLPMILISKEICFGEMYTCACDALDIYDGG